VKEVRGQASSCNPQQIAQYYDDNTARFLSLGGSGDVAAIHRAIWAPGVTTQA